MVPDAQVFPKLAFVVLEKRGGYFHASGPGLDLATCVLLADAAPEEMQPLRRFLEESLSRVLWRGLVSYGKRRTGEPTPEFLRDLRFEIEEKINRVHASKQNYHAFRYMACAPLVESHPWFKSRFEESRDWLRIKMYWKKLPSPRTKAPLKIYPGGKSDEDIYSEMFLGINGRPGLLEEQQNKIGHSELNKLAFSGKLAGRIGKAKGFYEKDVARKIRTDRTYVPSSVPRRGLRRALAKPTLSLDEVVIDERTDKEQIRYEGIADKNAPRSDSFILSWYVRCSMRGNFIQVL